MNAEQMIKRYGPLVGRRRTCETCAHLRATATKGRPLDRQTRPLTTFVCDRSGGREPWSVLSPACGKFEEAEA